MRKLKGNQKIACGAGVLALGSVVAKMLGALYRIPLTNILGAEGMGMYQLVFSVYALFMVLATMGIPTALSRIVAERQASGESAKGYFVFCMLILFALGALFSILMAVLSRELAIWQGNADTHFGFVVIAPAVVLVCIISGFRGYFQGQMYMLPTAVSNVVEQVVKLVAGICLAVLLKDRGVIYSVCGALGGVAISELVACIYMFVVYLHGKDNTKFERISKSEIKGVAKMAFPIAVVAIMMPLANFFDSIIVVNMLKVYGLEKSVATSQYGLASGPVNSLVNMPVVAIISLAVAIVPSVSMSRVAKDVDGVMLKSRLSVKLAYLLGIPFAFFFMVFAKNIITLIYPSLSQSSVIVAQNVLRIVAVNVVSLAVMQIYISLLQALDKTKYAVLSLGCAIIVKILLSIFLTKSMGIYGFAIASVCMGGVALLGVVISYYKICGMHIEKNVGVNLLLGVIMALSGIGVLAIVKNNALALCVGTLVCFAIYVWLAFLTGLVGKEDIAHMPLKRVLYALHRIIRFWEYKNET